MPLEIREKELPGIGRRYEIDLDDHRSVAVVIHTTGRRELFYRDDRESQDYEPITGLSDTQARTLGLFLVGAYYQPIATKFGQDSTSGQYVDWYSVEASSPIAGQCWADVRFETDVGGTLLGVEREGEILSTIGEDFTFEPGDLLIIIARDGTHQRLKTSL